MASAHVMVDGYGNIYAPMLPLLIPRLGLTLAAAGTLTMLFQLAASVAQIGFGHLADRWRPRALVMVGPVVSVTRAQPDRPRDVEAGARADSDRRRPRRRGVSSARGRAGAPPRAATGAASRCRSTSPEGRWAFRSVRWCSRRSRSGSGSNGRRCWRFPAWRSSRSSSARVPPIPLHPSARGGFGGASSVREAAGAPVRDRGPSHVHVAVVCHVRAGDAHAAGIQRRRSRRGRGAVSVRQRHRRILRRPGGGSIRRAEGHRAVARRVLSRSWSPRRF